MTRTPSAPVVSAVDDLVTGIRTGRRRQQVRSTVVLSSLGVCAATAFAVSIALGGSVQIPLRDIPAALMGGGDALTRFVIVDKRLPRALTALLVGALFGLSGVLYQRLISNVLATPDVIGVSAGASAGAVAVLVVGGGTGIAVQAGAVGGAIAAAAVIFLLSRRNGSDTYRLILVGIGIGACFASVTSFLLTFADDMTTTRAMRWLIGSLSSVTADDLLPLTVTLVAGGTLAVLLTRDLDTLRLGDPLAAGLGSRVGLVRIATLLLGAGLAAVATSVVGPIAFVALVAGPIAARLLPTSGMLPAALVGALILAVSDVIAQAAPLISPVPTGVVTGLVGAPVLIRLLIARKASR